MKNEELNIQSSIIQYLRFKNILVFSVPNGAHFSNVRTRMLMMKSGLLKGVADLIVAKNGKAIFLEVKTPKGRQQPSQKEFERRIKEEGFEYHIVKSIEDVENVLGMK